jgi:para-nitrobenzyl esterase
MPSLHLAESHRGRAWTYELRWSRDSEEGAVHGLDVRLVFGTLPEADRVSQRMRADWLAFATTGDPGWPPYDPATHTTRVYDAEPTVQPYPEERSRGIWQEHRFGTLDLAAENSRR